MSQPPDPYQRQFSFTGWSVNHPGEPHQGDKIDLELNEVKQSLDETQARLAEIQRDDGLIRAEALTSTLAQITQEAADDASAKTYADNLASVANKDLARNNLQLPWHYAKLDGSNIRSYDTIPPDENLGGIWELAPFYPQPNQALYPITTFNYYKVLGSSSARQFRASAICGTLLDYATWDGNGTPPSIVPRMDNLCAAIAGAGIPNPARGLIVPGGMFRYDYQDAVNLPSIDNPLASIYNIVDALNGHVDDYRHGLIPTESEWGAISGSDSPSETNVFVTTSALTGAMAQKADVAAPGLSKAWVSFDGTTTPPEIKSSHNVDSVEVLDDGVYVITFSEALSGADYCWTGSARSSGFSFRVVHQSSDGDSQTSEDLTVVTSGPSGPENCPLVNVVVHA